MATKKNISGQHDNINRDDPYEFPSGKCSDEFVGVDRMSIFDGDAVNPDDSFPVIKKGGGAYGKKEK